MLYGRRVRNALSGNRGTTEVAEDSQAADEWHTKQGGGMLSAGVGGNITGRGGDLIIIDDPVKNWEEADSEVIQKRNVEWFKTTLWTRREPGATVILLMTRWHRKDLAGFILGEELSKDLSIKPYWLRFPALAEATDPMNRQPGEPLCPDRYDLPALMEIRAIEGPRHWAGLYQQTPVDDASALIKQEWFQYYTSINDTFRSYITIDLAYSQKKAADYLVIMNTRIDTSGNIFVWDYIRARLPIRDFLHALFNMVEKTRALEVVGLELPVTETEDNSAIVRLIRNEMGSRGQYFRLVPIKPRKDKQARAMGFIHKISNGKVWFRKGMTELEDELLNFPTGDHDDMVDTLALLDEVLRPVRVHQMPRHLPPSAMSA